MAWRRTALWTGLLLGVALAAAGAAAAEEAEGTTATGDVDTYGVWPYTTGLRTCSIQEAIFKWEVELTLEDPAPGDRVLLTAQHVVPPYVAGAGVATYDDPHATATVSGSPCAPAVEVAGLTVSGDLGYTVSW